MQRVISIIALIFLPISILFFWAMTHTNFTNMDGWTENCFIEARMVIWPWTHKDFDTFEKKIEYMPILWNMSTMEIETSGSWQYAGVNHIGDEYSLIRCKY